MKKFNVEQAKKGKPVCTRDGREVEIFKFDAKNHFPIFGMVKDITEDKLMRWSANGTFLNGEGDNDLMMAPEKHKGWINIYHDGDGFTCDNVFSNLEDAVNSAIGCRRQYVTTIKIEWKD